MTDPWSLPERQLQVTMMLCDYAQVADGKMNIIGGGWTLTGPEPVPFGLALVLDVPWSLADVEHSFALELIDLDGVGVVPLGGDEPIVIEGKFEVGRPEEPPVSAYLPFMAALNSGPLPLPPGGNYEWRLEIDGKTHETWRLPFSTRSEESEG